MLGAVIVRTGDSVFSRLNRCLARIGLKPIHANLAAVLTAVLCGFLFIQGRFPAALIFLVIHGFFDYLDGGLRRASNQHHKDERRAAKRHAAADKLSECIIFLSLPLAGLAPWGMAVAASLMSLAVTFVGLHIARCDPAARRNGLFDRSDRILVFFLCALCATVQLALLAVLAMNVTITVQRVCHLMCTSRPVWKTPN